MREKTVKKRSGKKFVLPVVAVVFAVAVLAAVLQKDGKVVCYAVCYGAFDGSTAQISAQTVADRGGAGYVLKQDGGCFVVACAYESEKDATTVKDRLLADGEDVCVVRMESADKSNVEIFYSCNDLAAQLDRGADVTSKLTLLAQDVKERAKNDAGYAGLFEKMSAVLAKPDAGKLRNIAVCAFLGEFI